MMLVSRWTRCNEDDGGGGIGASQHLPCQVVDSPGKVPGGLIRSDVLRLRKPQLQVAERIRLPEIEGVDISVVVEEDSPTGPDKVGNEELPSIGD